MNLMMHRLVTSIEYHIVDIGSVFIGIWFLQCVVCVIIGIKMGCMLLAIIGKWTNWDGVFMWQEWELEVGSLG